MEVAVVNKRLLYLLTYSATAELLVKMLLL